NRPAEQGRRLDGPPPRLNTRAGVAESALAPGAVVRGSLGAYGMANPADPAGDASLPRSAVHPVGVLVRPACAEQVDVLSVAQCGAASLDCRSEYRQDRLVEPPLGVERQLVAQPVWPQPRR